MGRNNKIICLDKINLTVNIMMSMDIYISFRQNYRQKLSKQRWQP